jgi:cobalt-zinc-cadmium resistance protein CzcA
LDEGALWVTAEAPMSVSLPEANQLSDKMVQAIRRFPEVKQTLTQVGRTNDGTDPKGFFNIQIQVDLYPKKTWKRKITQEQLIQEMDKELSKIPGIVYNYSQPIRDNVSEAVAGVPASLAVKVFGPDFKKLDRSARAIKAQLATVQGVDDLGILKNLGQTRISY